MSKVNCPENIGQTFISITKFGISAEVFVNRLRRKLPVVIKEIQEDEVILFLPVGGCGFSLNQLRSACGNAEIKIFNLEEENGKYIRDYYIRKQHQRGA